MAEALGAIGCPPEKIRIQRLGIDPAAVKHKNQGTAAGRDPQGSGSGPVYRKEGSAGCHSGSRARQGKGEGESHDHRGCRAGRQRPGRKTSDRRSVACFGNGRVGPISRAGGPPIDVPAGRRLPCPDSAVEDIRQGRHRRRGAGHLDRTGRNRPAGCCDPPCGHSRHSHQRRNRPAGPRKGTSASSAGALIRLASEPGLLARLSMGMTAHIRREFDQKLWDVRLGQHYQEALSARRRNRSNRTYRTYRTNRTNRTYRMNRTTRAPGFSAYRSYLSYFLYL